MKPFTKKIVLESGREFYGYGFGADREATGEIVFNTSMVGYQEILSDPSYTDQMVVMTYPLIGNYGITDEDYETKYPTIGGMIVREYNDLPSNFSYTKTLCEVCEEYGIPCVWGIDTRMLTRIIRDEGTQRVIVVDVAGHGYALIADAIEDVCFIDAPETRISGKLMPGWARVADAMIEHEGQSLLVVDPSHFVTLPAQRAA